MGQGRYYLGCPSSLSDTLEVAPLAPRTIRETLQTILKSDPLVFVGYDEIGPSCSSSVSQGPR